MQDHIRMRAVALMVAMVHWWGAASGSHLHGQISSPGYPNPYPEDTEKVWTLSVPEGYRVQLHFTYFDLEPSQKCIYDSLEVITNGKSLGIFCGNVNDILGHYPGNQLLVSEQNSMEVRFKSDFSNEAVFRGFEAHYQAIDIDECSQEPAESPRCQQICHNTLGGYSCSCQHGYRLEADNSTCKARCQEFYSEISGHLYSPQYPEAYPPDLRCNYTIHIEKGYSIRIEFADLFEIDSHDVVPCPYDELTIEYRNTVAGPFCGTRSPDPIESRSNTVNIHFTTDSSGSSRGWSLHYSTDRIQCPDLPPFEHGTILPNQTRYQFLDGVVLFCDTGYKIMKDQTELRSFSTVCGADGEWDKDFFPVCQILDCGEPEELENGVFQRIRESSVPNGYQSEIRYSCEHRYSLESEGNGQYKCTDSRHWLNEAVAENIPYCAPVCGRPDRPPHLEVQRILGGALAREGNFPWQVLLLMPGSGMAGGILVSDRWVLTAAHVLRPKGPGPAGAVRAQEVRVLSGGLSARGMERDARGLRAERLVVHPGYRAGSPHFRHDLALLRLPRRLKMAPGAMPGCLPPPDAPQLYRPGLAAFVSGWGVTENNTLLDHLRYVRLPLADFATCARAMADAQSSKAPGERSEVWQPGMVCAGAGVGGQDSCQGDSGGALAVRDAAEGRWYIIGVVSWGLGCGVPGTFGVYTRVSNYRDWIDQVMAMG